MLLTVRDGSPTAPAPPLALDAAHEMHIAGRGLLIVNMMSQAWGVAGQDGTGTSVWGRRSSCGRATSRSRRGGTDRRRPTVAHRGAADARRAAAANQVTAHGAIHAAMWPSHTAAKRSFSKGPAPFIRGAGVEIEKIARMLGAATIRNNPPMTGQAPRSEQVSDRTHVASRLHPRIRGRRGRRSCRRGRGSRGSARRRRGGPEPARSTPW